MEITKTFYAKNRSVWRAWLEKNHVREKEIWLIFYKKHSGKPCVSYNDSVEEALCFGWIDSIVKRVDDEKYVQKFTPRKAKSVWSDPNRKRVQKMMEAGLMTDAGKATLTEAFYTRTDRPRTGKVAMPRDLKKALASNQKAAENFRRFAPGYQQNYFRWITAAKRPETRTKRIEEAVRLIEKNTKTLLK